MSPLRWFAIHSAMMSRARAISRPTPAKKCSRQRIGKRLHQCWAAQSARPRLMSVCVPIFIADSKANLSAHSAHRGITIFSPFLSKRPSHSVQSRCIRIGLLLGAAAFPGTPLCALGISRAQPHVRSLARNAQGRRQCARGDVRFFLESRQRRTGSCYERPFASPVQSVFLPNFCARKSMNTRVFAAR